MSMHFRHSTGGEGPRAELEGGRHRHALVNSKQRTHKLPDDDDEDDDDGVVLVVACIARR